MAASGEANFIPLNPRWAQNGVTVAGGHGRGSAESQLNRPVGLYLDDDQTMYIADCGNDRIVQWISGANMGQIVAGGNGRGDGPNQLNSPTDVMVDKETKSLIICDRENRRVVQWPLQNGTTSGKVLLSDIRCFGLTMDNQRFLYVTDVEKHEVKRYRMGETTGTLVAGGKGQGKDLSQLNEPEFVFVDETYSVYVSDYNNDRVMKWVPGATEGILVAGDEDYGTALTQLGRPTGLFVDPLKNVYVAEGGNHRVTRWLDEVQQGELVVGRNQRGSRADQLNYPNGLSFDGQRNLYVVDYFNDRVQRYSIENS